MGASRHPETNIHFLIGCLYRNWTWADNMNGMVENVETDANVLYMQLREDCAAQGILLNENAIRADLKVIRQSCENIEIVIDNLRVRDRKLLEKAIEAFGI